jgi:hypothetical protein
MKKGLLAVALIMLVVPVAYAASPATNAPSQGAPKAQSSSESPAKACKAERSALGVDAFAKRYGTNHNLRNAFGKCVSGKSKRSDETEKDEQDEQAEKDEDGSSKAVKQCKKERADMGVDAFGKKYGTNHNRANAFGKCVSSSSKDNED